MISMLPAPALLSRSSHSVPNVRISCSHCNLFVGHRQTHFTTNNFAAMASMLCTPCTLSSSLSHSSFVAFNNCAHSATKPTCGSPLRVRGARATDPSSSEQWRDSGVSCSRREVLGLGGLLAIGLNMHVAVPQADAEGACAELIVSPSGLAFCDTSVGQGIPATKGLLIKAHYTGKLENGQVFDSSYKRGKPLTFRIGVGEVIRGWDQGIMGADGIPPMLAGGKRTLRIPSGLGYGERGAGCRLGSCLIPPNSTLFFDVEFVGKA